MERYFRWIRNNRRLLGDNCKKQNNNGEKNNNFFNILENIILWDNSVNSISVVIVFNILFWGIVVLEIRTFVAASSAALVIVLCYSTVENQTEEEKGKISNLSQVKAEQVDKIVTKFKTACENLKQLRQNQPGVFCTAVFIVSLGLWIIGKTINGVLLAYTICMSILIGPALLLKVPSKTLSNKEWDSEIEEFLPAVTEDNLQVLKLASVSGDHSPTPISEASDVQNDLFTDDDLVGLKMPSHEEGSTDGLAELEFNPGETDVDGIKFQSGHFEKGSSSDEEVELDPKSKTLLNHSSDDSDSEFEIIDSREIVNFKID